MNKITTKEQLNEYLRTRFLEDDETSSMAAIATIRGVLEELDILATLDSIESKLHRMTKVYTLQGMLILAANLHIVRIGVEDIKCIIDDLIHQIVEQEQVD